MTEAERYFRDWLKSHAPESRVLAAFPEPSTEVRDDTTGEFQVLEVLEAPAIP